MLKKLTILPIIFFASFSTITSFSYAKDTEENTRKEDKKEIKIAVIDTRKVNEQAKVSKDLTKKISNKQVELQKKLSEKANEIENNFKKLESKRSILSAEEYQKQRQRLETDFQKLQMDGAFYSKVHEEATISAISKVQENIKKATTKVVTSNKTKYDFVMSADQTFYINNDKLDDITDKVIKELDKILETIDYNSLYKQAEKKIKSN